MKFSEVLSWELKNITLFPIVEVFTGLLVLQVVSSSMLGARTISLFYYPDASVLQDLMFFRLMRQIVGSLISAYISVSFIAVVSATMLFAYQFEAGASKLYLSLPVKRSRYFAAKFLVCFLVPFLMLVIIGFSTELFLNPSSAFFFFASPLAILWTLLIAGDMVFFVVSVALTISVFSRSTAVSLISSLALLYGLQLSSGYISVPVLPPDSLSRGFYYFLFSTQTSFWQQFPGLTGVCVLVLTPVVSACLLVVSYFYYCRRFEL